jgi:hypothetical protein
MTQSFALFVLFVVKSFVRLPKVFLQMKLARAAFAKNSQRLSGRLRGAAKSVSAKLHLSIRPFIDTRVGNARAINATPNRKGIFAVQKPRMPGYAALQDSISGRH